LLWLPHPDYQGYRDGYVYAVSTEEVRVEIYRSFVEESRAPMPAEMAARLDIPIDRVENALEELHETDVIALAPGTHHVWLAHPFSALDAPFQVRSAERAWDAICIWDALGVLALLDTDGSVTTSCPDCGDALRVEVVDGKAVSSGEEIVHFGVPASRWYEDVGYT
jgi:Alkylmercury lyase